MAAAVTLAFLISGEYAVLSRVLTIAGHNSTFWGRLLYWKDSIGIFAEHPLGIGYGGYPRLQHMIQTGVYTTAYIHNEYLQIGLDHGIVAMLAFILMMGMGIVDAIRSREELRAVMLVLFAVHIAWDFDLQYFAMSAMLLCLMDWRGKGDGDLSASRGCGNQSMRRGDVGQSVAGSKGAYILDPAVTAVASAVFAVVFLVMGTSQAALSAGAMGLSYMLYPWDSVAEEAIMYSVPDDETRAYHMERILSYDPYCANAWRLLAFRSASFGDYEGVVYATERYLELRRYDMEAYSDMVVMLGKVMDRDPDGATDILKDELLHITERLSAMEETTSPLAYRLRDLPDFTLSADAEALLK